MTEEIVELAKEKIKKYYELPPQAKLTSVNEIYAKITKDRGVPQKPELKKCWLISFTDDKWYPGHKVEVMLDKETKELVKIINYR